MQGSGIEPGTVFQDTYRIVRRIGAGGMGEVYEATHARLSGRYAVKILLREIAGNPEALARFRREAEITSALRHPNIVQVVDFNTTPDGAPYLVMEFLEGVDLATTLAKDGPMPLPRAVRILRQIASGLAAAHAKGIVHRDLKPQNVFLVPVEGQDDDFAKVVDFGISKVRSATKNLTRDSAVMGTPQYMSPEQALGQVDEVDQRTDQFALAAMCHEMLTGRDAFTGENLLAVMYCVVHEQPQPLAGLTPWAHPAIEVVLARAFSKKKVDRYASILEFVRALEAAASRVPAPAEDPARKKISFSDPTEVDEKRRPITDEEVQARVAEKPTTFRSTASELVGLPEAEARLARNKRIAIGVGAGAALAIVVGIALGGSARPVAPGVAAPPLRPATAVSPTAVQPIVQPVGPPSHEITVEKLPAIAPPSPASAPPPGVEPAPARPVVARESARRRPAAARPRATPAPSIAPQPPLPNGPKPPRKPGGDGLMRSDDL